MSPGKLDWNTFVSLVNRGMANLLAYLGFWQQSWWAQMFTVVMLIIAVTLVLMGPLIFAAWRLFRDGDRPGLAGALFILVTGSAGGFVLMLLFRLANQVVDRHPGPIL